MKKLPWPVEKTNKRRWSNPHLVIASFNDVKRDCSGSSERKRTALCAVERKPLAAGDLVQPLENIKHMDCSLVDVSSARVCVVESLALLLKPHCLRITTRDQRHYVSTAPYNKDEVSSHYPRPIPMHRVDASMSSLMSGKGFSSMSHRRRERLNSWNESDELGVFEATRYFSDATDGVGLVGGFGSRGAVAVEPRVPRSSDERLVSGSPSLMKAKKCGKQPGSPGAKLVGYLNSFFHHAASRRKPKCSNPTSTSREPRGDGEEVEKRPGDQKERRRSITGHCQSTKTAGTESSNFCPRSEVRGRRRSITEVSKERENWEKKQVTNRASSSGEVRLISQNCLATPRGRNKTFGRRGEEVEDNDGDSVSSSDLFELKIYDRGGLSDGLPVFATTDIQAIKRDTAISSSTS
ncbi:hypothetical protein GW17_00011685 [Ensete ventricosum]|nr:hypothetical protein GW17_00011685 [Ensete ventricosum]